MKCSLLPMAVLLPCMLAAAALDAADAPPRAAQGDAMSGLAVERGCTACHREEPVAGGSDGIIARAPSWKEIAARYRGHADAEDRLTRLVIGGSDPGERHWKNRAAFAKMLPNTVEVTPDEARALVRWILSLHG